VSPERSKDCGSSIHMKRVDGIFLPCYTLSSGEYMYTDPAAQRVTERRACYEWTRQPSDCSQRLFNSSTYRHVVTVQAAYTTVLPCMFLVPPSGRSRGCGNRSVIYGDQTVPCLGPNDATRWCIISIFLAKYSIGRSIRLEGW
jgi:hypothetical protein